jgi:hypothetical protein
MKKTRGRKSCETVSLTFYKGNLLWTYKRESSFGMFLTRRRCHSDDVTPAPTLFININQGVHVITRLVVAKLILVDMRIAQCCEVVEISAANPKRG